MRAWVSKLTDGEERCGCGHNWITSQYMSVATLVRYGVPREGWFNVYIHYDFDQNKYMPADKIIVVKDGKIVSELREGL